MRLLITYIFAFTFIGLKAQTISEIALALRDGNLSAELTEVNKDFLIISVAGSGPTDRDGNNPKMKNNSLKMLSDNLVSNGFSTLRIDKRGIGKSLVTKLQEKELSFDTFVYDLLKWNDTMTKLGFHNIYYMGHSEGSLVSIIASLKSPNIKGLISIAGAGTSADSILINQIKSQPIAIQNLVINYLDTLKKGQLLQNVPPFLNSLFRPSVQPYMISWIKYNPSIELSKLKIPVLILQGDSDLQVSIEDANKLRANSVKATLHILYSTNHVLKLVKDQTENQKSYMDPTYPINPELPKYISSFIKETK
jgi:pimeloyl-ACP methyl ester carboxylesterase